MKSKSIKMIFSFLFISSSFVYPFYQTSDSVRFIFETAEHTINWLELVKSKLPPEMLNDNNK